ncbi:hypothetical protein [Prevotellamassilia timonensis]|uniref:hypothetical protein n=1 Tax=Prevotellamassilia timonensis TaxID=1852370 RepID=UPI0023F0C9AE|nr:hypothetical protein [Prevotellamassilia timonensis]MDD7440470.1 hypothetical protein [Prevotellamassilia timonensis]
MTKKLATLVAMLACCVFGALAQRVATTPVTDVQTGDYLLLVHSDKTAADGSWAYINTSNKNRVSTDAASLGTTAYAGSKIENSAYIWHVEKQSDGKITIQSVAQKTYWPTAKGYDKKDYYPAHITTGSSANANAFELIALSDGFALKTTTTKKTMLVWEKDATLTAYVVSNDNSQIGYYGGYDDSKIESQSEIARVEFYPLQAFTELTYNYVFDGEVRASVKVNAVDGEEYPTPTTAISLPDFIAAPTLKPEGIYHDGAATSYNLQLASTLPFTLSTDANRVYYYLAAGAGTEGRTMLYANGNSLKLRAEAQANNLTAMRNDLWYVTGNPFDGLKFHNVGSGTTAMSKIALSDITELGLSPAGGGHDTWKIYKISDNAFGLYAKDWKKTNVAWKLNGSKVSFEKIDANAPNTSDAFAFQAIEATYVLPLHDSEADNAAFATTCAPFNFAIVGDDVKAYAGKLSADGKELDMKEIEGNVPANQGVILKAAMGVSEVTVKVVNTADAIDNDLKGTNNEMTDLSQVYVFGRHQVTRHVGFYTAAGDAPLPANRAYLDKPAQEAANAVAMNFGDGTVTNINTAISAQSADSAPIYDLSGRRVQHTVKGSLYIKGGRKFMAQ